MPVFLSQIYKRITGSDREWCNTYRILADDLETASEAASTSILAQEQAIHLSNVSFTRVRTSDVDPETDVFVVVPVSVNGTRAAAEVAGYLPLFNTARVDIGVTGGGRPSRKYYRLPFNEGDQFDGQIVSTLRDDINDAVAAMIANAASVGGVLIDPDSQVWATPNCFPLVQMRQLHRKRRKAVVTP